MNMKEELTNLFNKYQLGTADAIDILMAIEKYDKYIKRLNLDAQRYFDMLMDNLHKKEE